MASAQQVSLKALSAIQKVGVVATLVDPQATYATSGMVVEGPVEYAVWSSPLVDESKRWLDSSITATAYLSAYNLPVRPQPGWRLRHGGRTFVVVAAFPYSYVDTIISWRLDLGEVA